MKFIEGDKVVHDAHGVGTVQEAGVNGWCRVAFDNGTIVIVKTCELEKYLEVKKMKNMMRSNDDCFRCCLAEYFDIPYEDVPDFFSFKAEEKYTYTENMQRFELWLEERGYCYLMIRCNSQDGMPFIGYGNIKVIASLKKPERKYAHAVILHTDDNGDSWYISDPKTDSDYTFDDLIGLDIFIKR